MYEFLVGLFDKHPEFKKKPFYVTGESYAGHYVPAISYHLVKKNNSDINLKAIAIGNGWVDPYMQYPAYAQFSLENNLIDLGLYLQLQQTFSYCQFLIKSKSSDAMNVCQGGVNQIMAGQNFNVYDIRIPCKIPGLCYNFTLITDFLKRPDVEKALNVVGRNWTSCSNVVYSDMMGDILNNLRDKVAALVNTYKVKVLVYSGNKDFICNWRGGEAWTNTIFNGQKQLEFVQQEFTPWNVSGKPAGKYKTKGSLTFLNVYNSGHMVPMDQPVNALAMINQFFLN